MGRWVAKATAKIGARVESEPSISPVMAGCTRCSRNDWFATACGAVIPLGTCPPLWCECFDDRTSVAGCPRCGIPVRGRRPLGLPGVLACCWWVVALAALRGDGDDAERDGRRRERPSTLAGGPRQPPGAVRPSVDVDSRLMTDLT